MSRVRAEGARNVLLNVEDVSLAFGGVKALQQVSFDVFEHETFVTRFANFAKTPVSRLRPC